MPELPEVEAVAQTLRPLVMGRLIRRVHVLHVISTKPQKAARLIRIAEGQRVVVVGRRGKYLLLRLDQGLLTMHFRLDGQLLWFTNRKKLFARANTRDGGVHVDVALELDKGVLGFADRRHFGRVHAWESEEACPPLKKLGMDAFADGFTAKELHARLAR